MNDRIKPNLTAAASVRYLMVLATADRIQHQAFAQADKQGNPGQKDNNQGNNNPVIVVPSLHVAVLNF